jgi:tetratricopeptide (TPR) repeat protein
MEKIVSFKNDSILIDYKNYNLFEKQFIKPFEKSISNFNLYNYNIYKDTNVYKMINIIQNNNISIINNSEILFIIGKYYYYLTKYEKAFEYYEKAKKIDGNCNSEILNNIGYMYCHGLCVKESIETGIKYYEKAIYIDNNSNALNNLGYIYYSKNRNIKSYEKAIEYYEKAIKKDNNSHALNNLGYMYSNGLGIKKNYEKAIEYFEKSISNDNNINAIKNIINIYYKLEKYINYYYYIDVAFIKNITIYPLDLNKISEINLKILSHLYYKFKSNKLKTKILETVYNRFDFEYNISQAYNPKYIHLFLDGIQLGLFDIKKLKKNIFIEIYKEFVIKNKREINIKILELFE